MKDSSLRRLHLAAQSAESLFVMVRPFATAQVVRAVPDDIEPGGAAGALSQLLERWPALSDWLHQQIRQRKVWLEEVNSHGCAMNVSAFVETRCCT